MFSYVDRDCVSEVPMVTLVCARAHTHTHTHPSILHTQIVVTAICFEGLACILLVNFICDKKKTLEVSFLKSVLIKFSILFSSL